MNDTLRVALHNLGCKVNSYELEVIKKDLLGSGFSLVPFDGEEAADVYIINTCTVTNIADRKTRQMIHRARGMNPNAVICALGCYVDKESDDGRDADIDLAVGNSEKTDFIHLLMAHLQTHPAYAHRLPEAETDPAAAPQYPGNTDIPSNTDIANNTSNAYITNNTSNTDIANNTSNADLTNNTSNADNIDLTESHTRAFLKIQDGCNQFCTYCIIPYVRGRIKSLPRASVVDEARRLISQGYRELVLTGIHISSYGRDISSPPEGRVFCSEKLLELIEEISHIESAGNALRIRLGSLEPRIITEDFVSHLSRIKGICPHFHLSLQSGSDSVLRRMNRHYTTEEYEKGVELLRNYFDNPAITTDIIVGFPGETGEEFRQTLDFAQRIRLAQTHIFKYSKRAGTPAATAPGQLTEAEKTDRARELRHITQNTQNQYLAEHLYRELSVLFEEPVTIDGSRYMRGHSDNYIEVLCPTDKDLTNQILTVRSESISGSRLIASL